MTQQAKSDDAKLTEAELDGAHYCIAHGHPLSIEHGSKLLAAARKWLEIERLRATGADMEAIADALMHPDALGERSAACDGASKGMEVEKLLRDLISTPVSMHGYMRDIKARAKEFIFGGPSPVPAPTERAEQQQGDDPITVEEYATGIAIRRDGKAIPAKDFFQSPPTEAAPMGEKCTCDSEALDDPATCRVHSRPDLANPSPQADAGETSADRAWKIARQYEEASANWRDAAEVVSRENSDLRERIEHLAAELREKDDALNMEQMDSALGRQLYTEAKAEIERLREALDAVDHWLRESPIREIQMAEDCCGIEAPTAKVRSALSPRTKSDG